MSEDFVITMAKNKASVMAPNATRITTHKNNVKGWKMAAQGMRFCGSDVPFGNNRPDPSRLRCTSNVKLKFLDAPALITAELALNHYPNILEMLHLQ
ncbi:unnamed protein product [Allacma fusca]|uniref:Uncharacterized protein n=1 Tax=Allacma fusca TaxID=39272 RepID=A0A8J2LWJ7_9HEXA|nr:unnamed protein product [Allacma fusca]